MEILTIGGLAFFLTIRSFIRVLVTFTSFLVIAAGTSISFLVPVTCNYGLASPWRRAVFLGTFTAFLWSSCVTLGILVFASETYVRIARIIERYGGDTIEGFVAAHNRNPLLPYPLMRVVESCARQLGFGLFSWLVPALEQSAVMRYRDSALHRRKRLTGWRWSAIIWLSICVALATFIAVSTRIVVLYARERCLLA